MQLVFDATVCPGDLQLGRSLRSEYVVTALGEVRLRDEAAINRDLKTGAIEVFVQDAVLLNKSETPPIYIDDKADENELVRRKVGLSDLRRPVHAVVKAGARRRARWSPASATRWTARASPRWKPRFCPSPRPKARDSRAQSASRHVLTHRPVAPDSQAAADAGRVDKYSSDRPLLPRLTEDNYADRQPEVHPGVRHRDVPLHHEEIIYGVVERVFARIFREVKGGASAAPAAHDLERLRENYGSTSLHAPLR